MRQVRRGRHSQNGNGQVLKDVVPTEKVMEDDEIVEEIIDDEVPVSPYTKPRAQKPNIKPKL